MPVNVGWTANEHGAATDSRFKIAANAKFVKVPNKGLDGPFSPGGSPAGAVQPDREKDC